MMTMRSPADAAGDIQNKIYRVVSVDETTGPERGQSENWYCYTIVGYNSRITGLHRGTLEEVREYAEACAESFNLRSHAKNARALTWSSAKKKQPQTSEPVDR